VTQARGPERTRAGAAGFSCTALAQREHDPSGSSAAWQRGQVVVMDMTAAARTATGTAPEAEQGAASA
jgi:hypothetical protein